MRNIAKPIESTTSTQGHSEAIQPEYILSLAWMDEFRMLVNKHSHLGIIPDLAHMNTVELWGVYRMLRNHGGGACLT